MSSDTGDVRAASEQSGYVDQFTGKKLAHGNTSSFGIIGQADRFVVRLAGLVTQRLRPAS